MSPNPNPDSKVHGANMGPTWVLSAPDGPHVGPINLAIREHYRIEVTAVWFGWASYTTCVTRAISTSEYKQHILVWSSLIQALSRGLMVLSHYLGLCCLNGHLDACEHISVKFVFFLHDTQIHWHHRVNFNTFIGSLVWTWAQFQTRFYFVKLRLRSFDLQNASSLCR